MDITALTAQQATDQANVDAAQTALTAAQDALALTTAELEQAILVNTIEALTIEQVSTVNTALIADGSTLSIVDSTTPQAAAAPEEEPAA